MGSVARFARRLISGWGRAAAWGALIFVLVVQLIGGVLVEIPRRAVFDLYQRTEPRTLNGLPVVIVAIDDASLEKLGQWPWPRQRIAQLVSTILQAHPAALGIDMLWPEPDRQSPEQWRLQAGALPEALNDALRQLPSHDSVLAEALAGGPVVVGIHGDHEGRQPDTGILPPFRQLGGTVTPDIVPGYRSAIRNIAVLDHAAPGHGVLSVYPDSDGVFRRLPLVSLLSGRPAPGFDLEILRLAANAPLIAVSLDADAIQGLTVGPLAVPTEADGGVRVDFTAHDERRFVSAADVLSGNVAPQKFDQRLVLIGVTGIGLDDQRLTPLGPMPGTEIHAQFLENVIDGRLARRPGWARFVEPALTALLALPLILALPALRRQWQAPAALLPTAILMLCGFMLWRNDRLLLDVATPAIGQAVVLLALVGGSLAEADVQRRRLRRELEVRRLAAAKAEGELDAGRRIQMGILPAIASVADDPRFDLDAVMVPARQLGGDLYDFFKLDPDHLFLAIGDVSGKGVPASLFMALGKSLCKSCALRGESDIGAIINRANAEISRDNPEMLFITLFAGVLNVATGELRFCNAGHDSPYLLRTGAAPRLLAAQGGPPLCVMEEFPYETEFCQLMPGDLLCLTTDGVTEAMTADGALMGHDRVEQALAELPRASDAKTVADGLHAAVDRFVAGAEPSDDLTILTIRWNGQQVASEP